MGKQLRSKKLSFLILCFGTFLNWTSYGLVYPIFAASIFHDQSIFLGFASEALRGFLLGVLLAACPIAQFLSAPPIGELSDRKGRKPILQITTLTIALGGILAVIGVWYQSLSLLILGRIVTGIGAGNIAVINSSVADISSVAEKAKNFGLIAMSNGIGFAIGPYLGGKLSIYGYEVPFIFATIASLLNFIFILFFFYETIPHYKRNKDANFVSRMRHLWKMTFSRRFRLIFFTFFIFCFGWSFYWEFIPVTWIKSYSLDVSQIGNFYAVGSIVYVLSSGVLIRPIVKKLKPLPLLFFSLAFLGVFLLLLFHAGIASYWVAITIQQFLVALIFPIGTAIVSNLTSPDQQGACQGVFQSLQAFAFAITPFLGGVFLSLSYSSPFLLGGLSMLLACLILLWGYGWKSLRSISKNS